MAITCNPQDLADASVCFENQLSESQRSAINTYLLAQMVELLIPDNPTDPQTLLNLSCEFGRLKPAQLLQIQVYLLCDLMSSVPN